METFCHFVLLKQQRICLSSPQSWLGSGSHMGWHFEVHAHWFPLYNIVTFIKLRLLMHGFKPSLIRCNKTNHIRSLFIVLVLHMVIRMF